MSAVEGGIEVRVDTKSLKVIENVLSSMAARGKAIAPVLRKLGPALVGVVDRNFEAEGRPTKWQKRSPISQANLAIGAQEQAAKTKRYAKAKARGRASILRRASLRMMGNKILSQTGDLKKSIAWEAGETQVKVGPAGNVPYARIHQLGGVIRSKSKKALFVPCGKRVLRLRSVRIPARPYLVVPPGDAPKLARIAAEELEQQVRERLAKGR